MALSKSLLIKTQDDISLCLKYFLKLVLNVWDASNLEAVNWSHSVSLGSFSMLERCTSPRKKSCFFLDSDDLNPVSSLGFAGMCPECRHYREMQSILPHCSMRILAYLAVPTLATTIQLDKSGWLFFLLCHSFLIISQGEISLKVSDKSKRKNKNVSL